MGYKGTDDEIPEGLFDYITLWGVLEHLRDPLSVIEDLSQRLNERGKIILTTVSIDVGIPYNYRVPVHLYFFSNESIYNLFERVKMTVKECSHYHMLQDPAFYLDRVLKRGKVPEEIKKKFQ